MKGCSTTILILLFICLLSFGPIGWVVGIALLIMGIFMNTGNKKKK